MFGIVICNEKVVSRIENNRIPATFNLKGLNGAAVVAELGIYADIAAEDLYILPYKMLAEFDATGISANPD
jgi:hypothetical protein